MTTLSRSLCTFRPLVLVHGGAEDVTKDLAEVKLAGVRRAAEAAFVVLASAGSASDAVEEAVTRLEDADAFNAAVGSALNVDGDVEMDAGIMEGAGLSAGAVTVVRDVRNPISLARLVMERTPSMRFAGEAARRLALQHGLPLAEAGCLVTDRNRRLLDSERTGEGKRATSEGVGAVALDCWGNLAAGTSTGGSVGRMAGKTSCCSSIGNGIYADNFTASVSLAGHGESIMKLCCAHAIAKSVERGKAPQKAAEENLGVMKRRLNASAGAIVLVRSGEFGVYFTSACMPWAQREEKVIRSGVMKNECKVEHL